MIHKPRLLLFGISSFTGYWFAQAASTSGFGVVGVLTKPLTSYDPLRSARLKRLGSSVELIESAPLGSDNLLAAVRRLKHVDVVGWHHAVVGDFKSASYPIGQAIDSALQGIPALAEALTERGCRGAAISHSVFEADRGLPAGGLPIGRYGIAKRAVGDALSLFSAQLGWETAHFVICNPVGPFENLRLTAYLVREWSHGRIPSLQAPHWTRDNIPVDLLATRYADALEGLLQGTGGLFTPSYWPMKNREWAHKIAENFAPRLGLNCRLAETEVLDESEPRIRMGVEKIHPPPSWRESEFWDRYAAFYAAASALDWL